MIPRRITLIIPRMATTHVGELVAARDAISRALASAGLDWHDLAKACVSAGSEGDVETLPSSCRRETHSGLASFGDRARAARDLDRGRLTLKERAFVSDMVAKGFVFRPSPRQAAWLGDILDGLQRRAAA